MLTVSIEIKSTVNCKVALITEKQHCRLTLWKCNIDTGEKPIKTKVSEQKIPIINVILKRRPQWITLPRCVYSISVYYTTCLLCVVVCLFSSIFQASCCTSNGPGQLSEFVCFCLPLWMFVLYFFMNIWTKLFTLGETWPRCGCGGRRRDTEGLCLRSPTIHFWSDWRFCLIHRLSDNFLVTFGLSPSFLDFIWATKCQCFKSYQPNLWHFSIFRHLWS